MCNNKKLRTLRNLHNSQREASYEVTREIFLQFVARQPGEDWKEGNQRVKNPCGTARVLVLHSVPEGGQERCLCSGELVPSIEFDLQVPRGHHDEAP